MDDQNIAVLGLVKGRMSLLYVVKDGIQDVDGKKHGVVDVIMWEERPEVSAVPLAAQ